jgi:hypothetical protein
VPALALAPGEPPLLGRTFALLVQRVPSSPFNLAFGWFGGPAAQWRGVPLPVDLGPLGAPGCLAHLAPEVAVPLALAQETARWPVAVPADPRLAGAEVPVQVAVLVPGWNAGSFVVSNAGRCRIGTR